MSKESLKRLEEVTRRTFGEPAANDVVELQAEVERLTAELAAEKIHAVEATAVIIEAQAREKKLRAIPSHIEARDNPYIGTAQGVAVACDWFRQMMEDVT